MRSLIAQITKDTTPSGLIKIYQDYIMNDASLKEIYQYHKDIQIEFSENPTLSLQSRVYFEQTINTSNLASKLIGLSEMMQSEYYKSIINTQGSESVGMSRIQQDILKSLWEKLSKKQLFQLWRIKEIIFACKSIFQKSKNVKPVYYYIFGLAIRELLSLGFTSFDELKIDPIMGTNDISILSHRIEREYSTYYNNYMQISNDIEKRVIGITSMNDNYNISPETPKILGNIFWSTVDNTQMVYPDLQKFTLSKTI